MASIRDYFDLDFPSAIAFESTLEAHIPSTGESPQFIVRAHFDVTARVKYVSLYLPSVEGLDPGAFVTSVLPHVYDALALSGGNTIRLPRASNAGAGMQFRIENAPGRFKEVIAVPPTEAEFSVRKFLRSDPMFIYIEGSIKSEAEAEWRRALARYDFVLRLRDERYVVERKKFERPRAFISHDSRDKADIARPIAVELSRLGIPVWFDEFSLKPGDKLRESIEQGLSQAEKCVLILTPNFLGRGGWPKAEYDAAFTREIIKKENVIVPVWSDIEPDDVYAYSPYLVNIFGANMRDGMPAVVRALVKALEGA